MKKGILLIIISCIIIILIMISLYRSPEQYLNPNFPMGEHGKLEISTTHIYEGMALAVKAYDLDYNATYILLYDNNNSLIFNSINSSVTYIVIPVTPKPDTSIFTCLLHGYNQINKTIGPLLYAASLTVSQSGGMPLSSWYFLSISLFIALVLSTPIFIKKWRSK